jgi:uncharacterized protein YjiS (DUF1127 family)
VQQYALMALTVFLYSKHAKGVMPIRAHPRRGKGKTMKNFMTQLREAAAKRALYRRTRDEIASMPRRVAMDLGIFPEDAERIAHQAVWG